MSDVHLEPIPRDAELMTREEFIELVGSGFFIDYDGFGELATSNQVSDITIHPSDVLGYNWPVWATHVVWYNR